MREEIKRAFEQEKAERQIKQVFDRESEPLIAEAKAQWKDSNWHRFSDYDCYDTVDAQSMMQVDEFMDPDIAAYHQAFALPAVENLAMDLTWLKQIAAQTLSFPKGFYPKQITVAARKSSLPSVCRQTEIGEISIHCLTEFYVKTNRTVAFIVQPCLELGEYISMLDPFLVANVEPRMVATFSRLYPQFAARLYAITQLLLKYRPEIVSKEGHAQSRHGVAGEPSPDFREVPIVRYRVDVEQLGHQLADGSTRHFQCPSWGVSGHYRHYANGKVVWIKPYRKGAERDKEEAYSPKNYTPVTGACS